MRDLVAIRNGIDVNSMAAAILYRYIPVMNLALAPKLALSAFGLAFVVAGAALWAEYGSLVYFDTLAAGFVGCFI